jgi:hypothetical protein
VAPRGQTAGGGVEFQESIGSMGQRSEEEATSEELRVERERGLEEGRDREGMGEAEGGVGV